MAMTTSIAFIAGTKRIHVDIGGRNITNTLYPFASRC